MRKRDPVFGTILCMGVAFGNATVAIDFLRHTPIIVGLIVAGSYAFTATAICRSIYRDRVQ